MVPYFLELSYMNLKIHPLALFSVFMFLSAYFAGKFRLIGSTSPGVYALPHEESSVLL